MFPKTLDIVTCLRLTVCVLLTSAILACQHTPPPKNIDHNLRAQQLNKVSHWKARGKLSLSHDQGRNSASYTWEQSHEHFKIHLFGPLGQGSTWLKSDENGVSIEGADTDYQRAENPELLMQQTLGWQLPVSNLRYWITGLPSPDAPITHAPVAHGEVGIPGFIQDGWQIKYSKIEMHEGIAMPGKATFTRSNLRLIVVIKDWTF